MLDEVKRRKRGRWRDGEWIRLSDGQEWSFPLLSLPLPLDVEDIVRAVIEDEDADRLAWALIPVWNLARRLLERQYRLTADEVEHLLPFSPFSDAVEALDDAGRATAAGIVREFRAYLAPVLGMVRRSPPLLLPVGEALAARQAIPGASPVQTPL